MDGKVNRSKGWKVLKDQKYGNFHKIDQAFCDYKNKNSE